MLKKTITFKDLDGNDITEDYYFNLTEAEVAEMEFSRFGGLKAYFEKIIAEENNQAILAAFKEILSKAYGRRHEDGRQFVKSPSLWREFEQTGAYVALFIELLRDGEAAAKFVMGILPDSLKTGENEAQTKTKDQLLEMYRAKLAELESGKTD